jgi:hypothetical protein
MTLLFLILVDDVAQLIEQLGSDDYETRERATAALIDKGEVERLKAVETRDPEVRWRIKHILAVVGETHEADWVVSLVYVSEDGACVVRTFAAAGEWTVTERGLFRKFEPFPLDRIVALGTEDGREIYAVAKRHARFREHDLSLWRPIVAEELKRPVTVDIPPVVHLLRRAECLRSKP